MEINMHCTICWNIVDDFGQITIFIIYPSTLDSASTHYFWHPYSTKMEQYSDTCIWYWGQLKFYKTISLDPNLNAQCFYSVPCTTKFWLFANQFNWQYHMICNKEILTFVNVVLDSEGEAMSTHNNLHPLQALMMRHWPSLLYFMRKRVSIQFYKQQLWKLFQTWKALLWSRTLRQSYCIGSIDSIFLVLESSKLLQNCECCQKGNPLWCLQNVLHAFMSLLTSNHGKCELKQALFLFSITSQAKCFSINQMISPEPGFVAQLKGQLTTYKGVMVFINLFYTSSTCTYKKCYIIHDSQSQKCCWSFIDIQYVWKWSIHR